MNANAQLGPRGGGPDAPQSAPIAIEVVDRQSVLRVDREAIAGLATVVLRGEGVTRAEVSIAIVDDAQIRRLNRQHLDHDWPTDVITFRLDDANGGSLEAEVVVSAEMAAATAGESGADPRAELALYIVHGLLHLCGYDDMADADALVMRRREDEVLAALGLPNTFLRVGRSAGGREGTSWPG